MFAPQPFATHALMHETIGDDVYILAYKADIVAYSESTVLAIPTPALIPMCPLIPTRVPRVPMQRPRSINSLAILANVTNSTSLFIVVIAPMQALAPMPFAYMRRRFILMKCCFN
jgi:hypothetical protein